LQATINAYEAGTRTMADVLNAQSILSQSLKQYSSDQYNYLINTLTLKKAAGTLSPDDLCKINRWLTHEVNIASKIAGIYQPPRAAVVVKSVTASHKVKTKLASSKTSSTVERRKSSNSPISLDKTWLNAHQHNYTIELFNTKFEQHAQQFIRNNHLQGKATYYRAETSVGPRYRVIYGNYSTAKEAELAIQKLPNTLIMLHPWTRSFGKIQAEMKSP
jgi:septal ring-binding cell division protein DamX